VIREVGAAPGFLTTLPSSQGLSPSLFVFTRNVIAFSSPLPKIGISCSRGRAPSCSRRLCAETGVFLCKSIHSGRLSPSVLVALLSCAHCSGDTRPPFLSTPRVRKEKVFTRLVACAPPSCRSVSPNRRSLHSAVARSACLSQREQRERWACVDSMVRPSLAVRGATLWVDSFADAS
jgi:hypothetical protein